VPSLAVIRVSLYAPQVGTVKKNSEAKRNMQIGVNSAGILYRAILDSFIGRLLLVNGKTKVFSLHAFSYSLLVLIHFQELNP
jgi:hypothetical protein